MVEGVLKMQKIENIAYKDTGLDRHLLDVWVPDLKKFPVYINFHGGGMTSGDKERQNPFVEHLAKQGIMVVNANYRLYPNAKYPEFIQDAAAVVKWAMDNAKNYGEPTDFFVGGESAGGYISLMLCFDKKYLANVGIDADSLSGYVFNAGQPTAHFRVLKEYGIDPRRVIVDERAPIYHICGERKYPPMQIFVSDNDISGRYEQTMLLMATLKHFEYDMERVDLRYMKGYAHCKYTNEIIGDRCPFSDMVAEFIRKYEVKQ